MPGRIQHAAMAIETITVRPRRGRVVHATAMTPDRLNETLCGRSCGGWTVTDDDLTCSRCLEIQNAKPTRTVNQDPSGHWRTKIGKLADRLGYQRFEIWRHWSQIALQVEFETRLTRALSEAQAFRLTEACFDKQVGTAEAS